MDNVFGEEGEHLSAGGFGRGQKRRGKEMRNGERKGKGERKKNRHNLYTAYASVHLRILLRPNMQRLMQDFSGANYKILLNFDIHAAHFKNGAISCVLKAILHHFHDKKSFQKFLNKQEFFH